MTSSGHRVPAVQAKSNRIVPRLTVDEVQAVADLRVALREQRRLREQLARTPTHMGSVRGPLKYSLHRLERELPELRAVLDAALREEG